MTSVPSPKLIADALAFLASLVEDEADVQVARMRLDALRAHFPGVRLRLLWQREQYDDSLQYDLMIMPPDMSSISLSYANQKDLPWPLRGGQRISERLLLRVNGVDMELDQAIATLDFVWDEARLVDRLIIACIIRQELDESPIEPSGEDLQPAMDAFRRARGLLTAEATSEWLSRHCLSHEAFEGLIAAEAAVRLLRRRVTKERVASYFEQHRPELRSACISRIVLANEATAQRAANEILAGADFYRVAEAYSAQGLMSASDSVITIVRRDELPAEVAEGIFAAPPGSTHGPFLLDGAFVVIKLVATNEAILDDSTIDLIERRLFEEWLKERKESARVEWFWGNTARVAESSWRHRA